MARWNRAIPVVGGGVLVGVLISGCGAQGNGLNPRSEVVTSSVPGGSIHLFSQFKPTGKASVLVTGAIGDYGRSFPANSKGKANSNDNYEEVVLKDGTFLLDERKLNDVKPSGGFTKSTCSLTYDFKATVPVSLGTGAYAGIHGTLNAVAVTAIVDPRFTSGAHKGTCDDRAVPKPPAYLATMTAQGKVSFS